MMFLLTRIPVKRFEPFECEPLVDARRGGARQTIRIEGISASDVIDADELKRHLDEAVRDR